jgi:apolipoprotein D and lipocalin family protein
VRRFYLACLCACTFLLGACTGNPRPIETVRQVNLERFMGDWYVIASIPTFIEDQAYNAVESYARNDDGSIATRFRFNDGGFDGEEKVYTATGYVREQPPGNAVWGMQFIWPFRAEYRVIYLADDYSHTVIGRRARDYVWIMARTPQVDAALYQRLTEFIRQQGYDTADLRRVPQSW